MKIILCFALFFTIFQLANADESVEKKLINEIRESARVHFQKKIIDSDESLGSLDKIIYEKLSPQIEKEFGPKNIRSAVDVLLLKAGEISAIAEFCDDEENCLLYGRYLYFLKWLGQENAFLSLFTNLLIRDALHHFTTLKQIIYLNKYLRPLGHLHVDPVTEIKIESGEVFLGSNPEDGGSASDLPPIKRNFATFWVDQTEVTYSRYILFLNWSRPHNAYDYVELGDSIIKRDGEFALAFPVVANHPIVNVSYLGAYKFCHYFGKDLPTEEEWERVAKGVGNKNYPWGNKFDQNLLNSKASNIINGKIKGILTTPVGSYPKGASEDGVLDLAGNVWEWTKSQYTHKKYELPEERAKAVSKEEPGHFIPVIKGGSFLSGEEGTRNAYRGRMSPSAQKPYLGFRCVRRSF